MTSSSDPAAALLRLQGVSKRLGGRPAIDGIDLDIAPGEIVVLLGPNGAGKTTLLGTASGRIAPDAGTVTLSGRNPRRDPAARAALGFVPQALAVYTYLSVEENLEVFGRMMGVSRTDLSARVEDALSWSGLEARRRDRADTLSGGMLRRLNIVASLLHAPSLLMLDEPTVGVDVSARERIHELLRRLRGRGLGILLTTHDLEQAATLADRVVFMAEGRIRVAGAPDTLIREVYGDGRELTLTLHHPPDATQAAKLGDHDLTPTASGLTWTGVTGDNYPEATAWTAELEAEGLHVAEISVRDPGLEGVFLRLTGEALTL